MGLWASITLYLRLIGQGWWAVGIGVFASAIGAYLDVTLAESFPTWPWVTVLVVTALVTPFLAFRHVLIAYQSILEKAPRLWLMPRAGGLLVVNNGGRAEVRIDCALQQEFIGEKGWGPLGLLWQKTNDYRTTLLHGETALVHCVEGEPIGEIVRIVVRFHSPEGDNRLIFCEVPKGTTGRIGFVRVIPNTTPMWFGPDPANNFNVLLQEDGSVVLDYRNPNQEILDMLSKGKAT